MSKNNIFSNDGANGERVMAQTICDSFQESIDRNGEENIKRAIVIVKTKDGGYEMGYTFDELESHLGLLDVAKDILKETFGDDEE